MTRGFSGSRTGSAPGGRVYGCRRGSASGDRPGRRPEHRAAPRAQIPVQADDVAAPFALMGQRCPTRRAEEPALVDRSATVRAPRLVDLGHQRRVPQPSHATLGHARGRTDDNMDEERERKEERRRKDDGTGARVRPDRVHASAPHVDERPQRAREPDDHDVADRDEHGEMDARLPEEARDRVSKLGEQRVQGPRSFPSTGGRAARPTETERTTETLPISRPRVPIA